MSVSEAVMHLGLYLGGDLHNSSHPTQPHSILLLNSLNAMKRPCAFFQRNGQMGQRHLLNGKRRCRACKTDIASFKKLIFFLFKVPLRCVAFHQGVLLTCDRLCRRVSN